MKKICLSDLCAVMASAALLLGFGIAMLVCPQKSFSETENRALTVRQAPTLHSLADGSFAEHLTDVYTDQFPLRSSFTALKATAELALGKGENNGVLFCKEGYLLPRSDYESLAVAEKNLAALDQWSRLAEIQNIPLTVLFAPRGVDVMTHLLPRLYPIDTPPILRTVEASGLPYTLPLSELQAAADTGRAVWYKTDHHWTTHGAYLAYEHLASFLAITPCSLSYFTPVTVSEGFYGTSASTVGGRASVADSVVLYRYPQDERYTVTNGETNERSTGLYDFSALERRDHYAIFLGGNYSQLTVSDPTAHDRPRLLLIKDSFANALIPFLALHFDLEVIDPRYRKEAISFEGYDQILIVQGIDTLATDPSLTRLIVE